MSDMYCDYKGIKYKAKKRNGDIIITSKEKHEEFSNYIDVVGNEHEDLFMKNVGFDEIDLLYEENILIKYKGIYFQLFADKIFKNDVLENSYMIWTNSENLAKKYEFEKQEQFVFSKNIEREEIEAVKTIKKPILNYNDIQPTEEILEGDKLDKWLDELV